MKDRIIELLSRKAVMLKELIVLETEIEDDIGLDSLDKVELCMELEEEFDINIPDEEMDKFVTVGDIIEFVEKAKKWKT